MLVGRLIYDLRMAEGDVCARNDANRRQTKLYRLMMPRYP